MKYNFEIIYSDRRTMSITVRDGKVVVRAPKNIPENLVRNFISKHSAWIDKHMIISTEKENAKVELSDAEIKKLRESAREYLENKTQYFAKIMGLKYSRVTITSAKTRFGSCSSKGNISYSYRLMLYPEPAREYVVVHELAHLVEMNHSSRFYNIVEKYLPDYKERRRMLK